ACSQQVAGKSPACAARPRVGLYVRLRLRSASTRVCDLWRGYLPEQGEGTFTAFHRASAMDPAARMGIGVLLLGMGFRPLPPQRADLLQRAIGDCHAVRPAARLDAVRGFAAVSDV